MHCASGPIAFVWGCRSVWRNASNVQRNEIMALHKKSDSYARRGFAQSHPRCDFAQSHPRVRLRTIPPTAVGGLVQILSTDISRIQCNPTHGSGWILQILARKGFEQSTNYRWWDSAVLAWRCRKDLKKPPTAVGGI